MRSWRLLAVLVAGIVAVAPASVRAGDELGSWEDISVSPVEVRVYPILDLVTAPGTHQRVVIANGGSSGRVALARPDASPVLERLRKETDRRYWADHGGPGLVQFHEDTFSLIVTTSADGHAAVAAALAAQRQHRPPSVRISVRRFAGFGSSLPEALKLLLDPTGRGRLLPEQVERLQDLLRDQTQATEEAAPPIVLLDRSAGEVHWERTTANPMSVGVAVAVSPDRRQLTVPVQVGGNAQQIVEHLPQPEWVNAPLADGGAWLLDLNRPGREPRLPMLVLVQTQVVVDQQSIAESLNSAIIPPPPPADAFPGTEK